MICPECGNKCKVSCARSKQDAPLSAIPFGWDSKYPIVKVRKYICTCGKAFLTLELKTLSYKADSKDKRLTT